MSTLARRSRGSIYLLDSSVLLMSPGDLNTFRFNVLPPKIQFEISVNTLIPQGRRGLRNETECKIDAF